jgi:hypothetical protein
MRSVSGNAYYRIASSKIIADVIDGEAVLVNLESGDYYTLDPVGRDVWELMVAGWSCEAISTELTQRYIGEAPEIRNSVTRFFSELESECLVAKGPDGPAGILEPPRRGGERPAFTAPVLMKYTDMEDLLTLDPVHEVDDLGWPHPQPPHQPE